MEVNCNDCVYAGRKLIENTLQEGKHYTNTIECKLGYEIGLGGQPGCDGKEFELKRQ